MFDIELDEGGPTMRKLKLPYNKDSQLSALQFHRMSYCYTVCAFPYYACSMVHD